VAAAHRDHAHLTESIRADNACLEAARRPGVTLAMHLCRGNNRSHWYAEGGYDTIAEELFSTLAVDRFLLEYDDERSGTFEPLRFVPRGKTVVLGLVSSKRPELENGDDLARRGGAGLPVRSPRGPRAQPAVRVCLDNGGQPLE
jgi:5-methyltetrahydropteroyltriglutamate--homocysteine methyltransferase